jgi:putative spermidine/putrescine transport system permease protein
MTTVRAPARPALRHRLAERGIDRTLLLLLPGLIFVGVLFFYPLMYGLTLSFQPRHGGSPFTNYRDFFRTPFDRNTILTTFKIAMPAALLNVLASIPLAFRLRGRVRGKRLITTLLVLPITLGTVLTADGMLNFFGLNGWFNRVLRAVHLVDQSVTLTGNYWGVLISLIISGFPFAFLLTLSYLSGIDPSLESAASTLGAGSLRRFRFITLPLLAPGLAMTFCLTFVLAFSVFPSAIMVGDGEGRTRVISIAAYDAAFDAYDYSKASAIAMIMAVIMLIVVSLVLFGRGRLYRGATGGKG